MHKSITVSRVAKAVERSHKTLDNPGFCKNCGKSSNSCEPDAENNTCDHCGKNEVFGAEQLLVEMV